MNVIASFLAVVDAFERARNVKDGTVSGWIFNDGSRIKELRAGGEVGALRLERAFKWLSDHWPQGAKWPEGVERPRQEEPV